MISRTVVASKRNMERSISRSRSSRLVNSSSVMSRPSGSQAELPSWPASAPLASLSLEDMPENAAGAWLRRTQGAAKPGFREARATAERSRPHSTASAPKDATEIGHQANGVRA